MTDGPGLSQRSSLGPEKALAGRDQRVGERKKSIPCLDLGLLFGRLLLIFGLTMIGHLGPGLFVFLASQANPSWLKINDWSESAHKYISCGPFGGLS